MQKTVKKIFDAGFEFFWLSILVLFPPILIFLDVHLLGNLVGEFSLTELCQEGLIFTTAFLFGKCAWYRVEARGFFVLLAGFFTCILLRELDGVLDTFSHGFWKWPTLMIAITCVAFAVLSCQNTTVEPFASFIGSKQYYFLMIGLLVILVFSRVFGSGNLLWENLMKEDYNSFYKTVLQEGLELFGYILICYGAASFWRQTKKEIHFPSHKKSAV